MTVHQDGEDAILIAVADNGVGMATMTFLILGYVPIVFLVTYWPDLALAIPRMAGFAV